MAGKNRPPKNPVTSRGRVRSNLYTLHGFASYSHELTNTHRRLIRDTCQAISESLDSNMPLARITVTGHAAFWSADPTPEVPYHTQGRRRALAVLEALEDELAARDLAHLVDVDFPRSASTSEPIGDNATRAGRALNRRAEILIEEMDPELLPTRWTCRIEAKFGAEVVSAGDLNDKLPKGGTVVCSGVLVSDRHVLTSAHMLWKLRRVNKGRDLKWQLPSRIRVIPGARGGAHLVTKPHGTWGALQG